MASQVMYDQRRVTYHEDHGEIMVVVKFRANVWSAWDTESVCLTRREIADIAAKYPVEAPHGTATEPRI